MIKQLDEGIELKKYKYSNHSLAIRKWKEKDRGTPIPKQIKGQEKKMCPSCGNELSGLFCKTCMIQYNEKMEANILKKRRYRHGKIGTCFNDSIAGVHPEHRSFQ